MCVCVRERECVCRYLCVCARMQAGEGREEVGLRQEPRARMRQDGFRVSGFRFQVSGSGFAFRV